MSGHTQGPWLRCNGTDIFADSDINAEAQIADCCFKSTTNPASTEAANATRIVACVNACDGISNAALDAGVIGKLVEALEWAAANYENGHMNHVDFRVEAKRHADAAIALVKGEVA